MSRPVAVVTGASRGIGKRFCIDLAKHGYDVVATARSSDDSRGKLPGTVEETAALARKEGGKALAVALDVRDESAIAKLADRVYDEFGRCDLVVNNAALAPPKAALDDSTKRWRLGVDVNVNGPFYFVYYFAPRMAEAGGGRIVNISSAAAVLPSFGRASYTTTKAALEAMTQSLGHDLRKRKVAVNCIRLDLPVWTEGFADTLPPGTDIPFEDAVIMSDALLWFAEQPFSTTGEVLSIPSFEPAAWYDPRRGPSRTPQPEGGLMETEKFLNRLEETLSQLVRQQEAICAELVGMRERVDALGEAKAKSAGGAPTREELLSFLDQFRAGEALGEASTKAWIEASDVACVKGGLRVVAEREGMHARLLADCIRAHGGTPRFELPEAVCDQAMKGVSDRSRGDAAKVLDFVKRFGDTEKALAPIYEMADRLDDDPETQSLLRTIAQDERSTLEFFQQACQLLNS